jgi:hypothetical protein
MEQNRRPPNIVRILYDLKRMQDNRPVHIPAEELEPRLEQLRAWQSERLAATYADLLAEPQFTPACRFFMSDVYAARDLSQRDRDFERLYDMLARLLPGQMLHLLKSAIQLNQLSNALDQDLLNAIFYDLGADDGITAELYAEGYRICDNYEARFAQIELLVNILGEVGEGSHLPMVGFTLRLARAPAQRFGWFELHDFLERGYTAFKQMHDVDRFVSTIEKREIRILNAIFACDPVPFLQV